MDSTTDKLQADAQAGYDLEVLCASWNPLAAAIAEPAEPGRQPVAKPASAEIEDFLSSFYRFQQG